MLTLRQVFDGCMLLLGYDNPDFATAVDRGVCFGSIQSALQVMQSAGEDYYTREPLTVTLAAGTACYRLDSSVTTVLAEGRLSNGQLLQKLITRAQYQQFAPLFLGISSAVPAQPMAYWTEALRNTASGATDSTVVNIWFAPQPDTGYTATLDVIRKPPVYTADQLCGTSPVIPVPHEYAESIFMPLVRWTLMTHPKWYKHDLEAQVQAQYERALRLLGFEDPRRPKPMTSNSGADVLSRAREAARGAARTAYNDVLAGGGG